MPELIAGMLLSFFAIVGVVEIGRWIKNYMLAPCAKSPVLIVTCSGHDEQIEYCIRSIANQANEICRCGKRFIIVVDEGMDEETRSICERLKHDIDGLTVCRRTDLLRILDPELQS